MLFRSFSHGTRATTTTTFSRAGRKVLPVISVPMKLFTARKGKCVSPRGDAGIGIDDEGFYEERRFTSGTFGTAPVLVNLNLVSKEAPFDSSFLTRLILQKSTFSISTTSTSNYVEVDLPPSETPFLNPEIVPANEISAASSWCTLSIADQQYRSRVPTEQRRRLKKSRGRYKSGTASKAGPTDPSVVLAREHYNHVLPNSSSTCVPHQRKSIVKAKALFDRLSMCKKSEEQDERWVCVGVTHKVTQRVM